MPSSKNPLFDWDDANVAHIARHGVMPEDVESIVLGASVPLAVDERAGEERHTDLGETAEGRLLLVVWTWRRQRIRVVTAFPANRRWRALWRQLKKGGLNG
jgi:uncharacterized protein